VAGKGMDVSSHVRCCLAGRDEVVAMLVPRTLERENAGIAVFRHAARNGLRLGLEMLRLTARCCGEVSNQSQNGARDCDRAADHAREPRQRADRRKSEPIGDRECAACADIDGSHDLRHRARPPKDDQNQHRWDVHQGRFNVVRKRSRRSAEKALHVGCDGPIAHDVASTALDDIGEVLDQGRHPNQRRRQQHRGTFDYGDIRQHMQIAFLEWTSGSKLLWNNWTGKSN